MKKFDNRMDPIMYIFFSSKDVSDEKVFGYAEFFPCINVNTAKVQIKYDFVKETKFVRLNSNLDNK
jgi:hypothetical protein